MENRINIGDLDTLVTLRSCTIGQTGEGGKVYNFRNFRDVYAKVDRRVNEQVNTGNLEEGDFVQLTIYKVAELDTRWQVKIDGVFYEITAIDPVSRYSPLCILTIHALN